MKNKYLLFIVSLLLIVSIVFNIQLYKNNSILEKTLEANEAELLYKLHLSVRDELDRFVERYETDELNETFLLEHFNCMAKLCSMKMGDINFMGINNMQFIATKEIDNVNGDLVSKYRKLIKYIDLIYYDIPSNLENKTDETDWVYLIRICSSMEYREAIASILNE